VIETATIEKVQAVESAEIGKKIVIASKQADNLRAEALREAANAERESAAQNVITTKEKAEAEREKAVALIKADESAQKDIIEARAQAAVAAEEAKGRADATANEAEGKARAVREQAQAESDAATMRAAAIIAIARADYDKGEKEAAVRRMFVEAENRVSVPILATGVARDLIARAPEIVRELMKPAERISDLKILQVTTPFGSQSSNGAEARLGTNMLGTSFGPLAQTLLQAGAAYPIFKEIMQFAKTSDGEKIVDVVRQELGKHGIANGNGGTAESVPAATSTKLPQA